MSPLINSPLLSKQRLSVEAHGDLVRLEVGNWHLDMPYETALQVSQWMRVRAKEAKRNAGELSRQWRTLALLEGLKV